MNQAKVSATVSALRTLETCSTQKDTTEITAPVVMLMKFMFCCLV